MADDDTKKIEARAYQRGYTAGRKRKQRDDEDRRRRHREDAFWQRAFLAALTPCVDVRGWTCGDKPINNIPERTALAADFADEALRLAKLRARA